MGKFQLWLATDRSELLSLIENWISIEYVRTINGVGNFEIWSEGHLGGPVFNNKKSGLQLAMDGESKTVNSELLRPDRTIQIWRRPGGPEQLYGKDFKTLASWRPYTLRLETVGFLRSWDVRATSSLLIQTALRGPDVNSLFERRIIAYPAASSQSLKSDFADDMLKAMVRENLGASAVAGRDLSSLGFSVQADTSQAPSITMGFAWQPLLSSMQKVADASRQAGTPLYFSIIPTSTSTFRFVTAVNRPGQDRTVSGGNPLVFGLKWGNMSNAIYNVSHLDEQTYIYSLGTGREDDRKFTEVADEIHMNASVWNRVEGVADAGESDDRDAIGNAKLAEMRRRVRFSADIHDMPDTPYGGPGGWDLGDEVTVSYLGIQFDCVIEAVHVKADRNGKETIRARVEHYS